MVIAAYATERWSGSRGSLATQALMLAEANNIPSHPQTGRKCLPPMKHGSRYVLAVALVAIAACSTLPDAPQSTSAVTHPVEFASAQGEVSRARSNAILRGLSAEAGKIDSLRSHLAQEQAINHGSPLVLGNRLELLQDGPATYKAMFAAIRGARDHINLETYIFESGKIGDEFAALLLAKQAAGVQVNLIYDSVGSIGTPKAFFEKLSAAGIRVLEFNPINPTKLSGNEWLLNNRDHRKLLLIDGRTAFVGGINISASYSRGSSRQPFRKESTRASRGWRDTQLEIEGPVVAEFQRLFLDTWARQNGPPLSGRHYFPQLGHQGDEIVRAVASTADAPDSPIYLTLLSAIGSAEQSIHLTNAYFAPDPQLLKALTDAAQRGVDVQMILPGKTDSWAVFQAGRSHYAELLRAGIHLYERRDTVLHSKTATIDGVWSTVGSTNLDWRSFLHNDEVNAVILGHDFARQMEAMFAKDLAASAAIDPQQWKRRSVLLKIQEQLARLFEYWL
ncbi:MAG: phospholipase D-like domain-containing protein [Thiobacillaceae bacterium]